MNVTFAKCDSILKTLPIGFYTGRRIETTLDENEGTSFYSPMEDKIVVSYPIIAHRFASMPETSTCSEEEAVRSMLYHEVSHAILTPAKALRNSFQLNVFEDERIETVLSDFYHDVNFRKQLYDIHGGHAPKATDSRSAFFNAVRFRVGPADIEAEVERMLEKYAPINRLTKRWDGSPSASEYESDVEELWRKINKKFAKNPKAFQPENGKGELQKEETPKTQNNSSENNESNGKEKAEKAEGENAETKKTSENGTPHKGKMSLEDVKKIIEETLKTTNLNEKNAKKVADFQKAAEIIITNFNKKNKSGNGINAYSGVFNPRAVVRKDYRYFERSMATQGNNKFGTCHLNLIIDSSGSFWNNQDLVNGILAALTEIERKNRNFSMDVAFINTRFRLCQSVRERVLEANGGNDVPDNMKEILMKLQKPNTCNYNIILFDGDAFSNHYGGNCGKIFSAFDMKQTTLITDPDNLHYMNPAFKTAKVVITNNYTAELIDNILKAFTIAFG